jgi:hypothetical protein
MKSAMGCMHGTVTLHRSILSIKGQFLITDIYLCDGTWRVSPKLPTGKPTKLSITELGFGRVKSQLNQWKYF